MSIRTHVDVHVKPSKLPTELLLQYYNVIEANIGLRGTRPGSSEDKVQFLKKRVRFVPINTGRYTVIQFIEKLGLQVSDFKLHHATGQIIASDPNLDSSKIRIGEDEVEGSFDDSDIDNLTQSFNNISIVAGNQSDGFGNTITIPNSTSQSSPKQERGLLGNILNRIYPLTGNQQLAQLAEIPSVAPISEEIKGSEFSTDNSSDSRSVDELGSDSDSKVDQTIVDKTEQMEITGNDLISLNETEQIGETEKEDSGGIADISISDKHGPPEFLPETVVEQIDNISNKLAKLNSPARVFNLDTVRADSRSTPVWKSSGSSREEQIRNVNTFIRDLRRTKELQLFESDSRLINQSLNVSGKTDIFSELSGNQASDLDAFIDYINTAYGSDAYEKREMLRNLKQKPNENVTALLNRILVSYYEMKRDPAEENFKMPSIDEISASNNTYYADRLEITDYFINAIENDNVKRALLEKLPNLEFKQLAKSAQASMRAWAGKGNIEANLTLLQTKLDEQKGLVVNFIKSRDNNSRRGNFRRGRGRGRSWRGRGKRGGADANNDKDGEKSNTKSGKSSRDKFNIRCFVCGKAGHRAADCYSRHKDSKPEKDDK